MLIVSIRVRSSTSKSSNHGSYIEKNTHYFTTNTQETRWEILTQEAQTREALELKLLVVKDLRVNTIEDSLAKI